MHVSATGVNERPVVLTEGRAKSSANVHWQAYLRMTVQNITTKREPITSQDNRGWQSIAQEQPKTLTMILANFCHSAIVTRPIPYTIAVH